MKISLRWVFILFLVLAAAVGCSQKSGSQEQAAAPDAEQTQPQAVEQAQPMEQQAAMPAVEEEQPAMAEEQMQEQVAPAEQAVAQPEEISGTVVRTEDGIALFSDVGHFLVDGQQLDELVGKNVKVTATMAEGAEKPTISIVSVYILEGE